MTYYIEKQRFDYSLDHIRDDIASAKVGEGVVEIKGKKNILQLVYELLN